MFLFANALIQSLWWYFFLIAFWCERQCRRSWPFMYFHSTSVWGTVAGRLSLLTLGLAVLALCLTWCGKGAGVSLSPIADWLHLSFTLFASPGEKWYSTNSCMWEIFLIALANISISLCHKQVKWNTFIITMRHRRATIYLQTAMEKTERKQIMLVNYQRPHIQLLPVKI